MAKECENQTADSGKDGGIIMFRNKYIKVAVIALTCILLSGTIAFASRGLMRYGEDTPEEYTEDLETVETTYFPTPDEYSLDFEKSWILEHAELFPEGRAKKAKDNPELIHFMFMLGNNDTMSDDIDTLSEKEVSGNVPYLFQWDKRWGFHEYGDNNIGFSGCGPTCLAMILAYYNKEADTTPATLADYAMDNGYYETGSGTRWAFMVEAAEAYGINSRQISSSEIPDELSEGHPVIASVGKGHFTKSGHFIVLAGIENGTILVHDPNNVSNSMKKWNYNKFKNEIKSAWVYVE